MTSITIIPSDTATEINRAHALAVQHADEAVAHAKKAGNLLLQVKSQLQHGEFLPWVRANLQVTPRTAQRYIAAALGRTATRQQIGDTLSHLSASEGRSQGVGPTPTAPDWEPHPVFMPQEGHCAMCVVNGGTVVLEPSSAHPGHWFVSLMCEDHYDCTARPVHAKWVELTCSFYGLPVPSAAEWSYLPSAGVRIAMETLLSPESIERLTDGKETIEQAIARMQRTSAVCRQASVEGEVAL